MRAVDGQDAIRDWVAANSIPLAPDALTDDSDLAPFDGVFEGAYVVGLGEPTHGTKEFFDLRLRLTRFLVVRMGFSALAIEASYSAAERLNDFVLGGKDDLHEAMTALGSVMWDTEDFAVVMRWLRTHNESVADSRKVRLWGLDIYNTEPGRTRVLIYLGDLAPELVPAAAEVFGRIGAAEATGYLAAHKLVDEALGERLEGLIQTFVAKKSTLIRASSARQYAQIEEELHVIWQAVRAQLPHQSPAGVTQIGLDVWARSKFLAENLVVAMANSGLETRTVLWAHNVHVRIGSPDPRTGTLMPNMGHHLRQTFGLAYYALGLEMNKGTYLARVWLVDDDALGDLTIGSVPPAPRDSMPWLLSQARSVEFLLDFRHSRIPQTVREWLAAPRVMHELGWARGNPPLLYTELPVGLVYDGLLFTHDSSPTTPTPNALRTVNSRAAS